ncbi:chaperone NapD [Sulfurisoma sediminicola]|uniref:Chaperone NapD n=1 Tax=Sulfurisoma sediminicola TaxID=1381557 RepID=A0A497XMA2_9PROT|nr:chaperone NapD [Sulfurisoma sediminicola]RLJ68435.1 periplasmic nitrate reductase chaperone NapD [Sulfurisoma sediminicola]
MNISSAIVHARPGHAAEVQSALAAIAGVEIHAVSAEGKLIITIESPGDRETADIFEAISQMDHVMSTSMVYHQTEAEPEAEIQLA